MPAYYNEIDPFCAQWLRNLIAAGHIAPGDIDERSIADVQPDDLASYDQCHFFAGIGIWSAALRRAGWDDARPVWTGSCPCQPLSAAGKGLGTRDERHLWPHWFKLIEHCRPLTIFGEQVASKDGLAWLDIVCADLENAGYPVWPVDLCAAGVGAPHIRQRLWFMAHADQGQRGWLTDGEGRERDGATAGRIEGDGIAQSGGDAGELADAERTGVRSECGDDAGAAGKICEEMGQQRIRSNVRASGGDVSELADADGGNAGTERIQRGGQHGFEPQDGGAMPSELGNSAINRSRTFNGQSRSSGESQEPLRGSSISGELGDAHTRGQQQSNVHLRSRRSLENQSCIAGPGPTNGFWSDAEWIACTDGKARPVKRRLLYVANGYSGRMDVVCADETETINGPSEKTGPDQILHRLRETNAAQTVRRQSGRYEGVQSQKILRSKMYGGRNDGKDQGCKREELQTPVRESRQGSLRNMRQEQRSPSCSSYRPQSTQQCATEFDDFVRLLPSAYSLAKLCGDTDTAEAVQALCEACNASRSLLDAPHALQAVWRSFIEENKDRLRMAFEAGGWMIGILHPLAINQPNRVGILRAAGNAINLEAAAEFIKAASR